MKLVRGKKLRVGDRVASISHSWGGAGDERFLWRYHQGKKWLEDVLGLEVIEMNNTLSGRKYIYDHPEKRAEDLMEAFKEESIKGIISCIGGNDTIRLLPYIDYDVIRDNPKVFLGYSDSTIIHYICFKAGLSSVYGPAILTDFAENLGVPKYTEDWIKKLLFSSSPLGEIPQSKTWTSQDLSWDIENKEVGRKFRDNNGYELLQGQGLVRGRLIGGCIEVMEYIKETEVFPDLDDFNKAILFLETSEDKPGPDYLMYWLRNYGAIGVLDRINGIIFAKPKDEAYYEEYKKSILRVLSEYGREDLPVLYNLSFGHCEPKFPIPYGVLGEIDCNNKSFSILESGLID